ESMRLYPPAWAIARRALEDVVIGDRIITRGTIVIMSQYVMHHDERYFPDPWKFDPERWTPDLKQQRPKYSYFPFGGGSRLCIGEHFAWMEAILILATLCRRWRAELIPDQQIKLQPVIT